jgi:hypothetical protein
MPPLAQALRAVVKIFTTMARPNYASPWTTHPQTTCTSTGWVLADEDEEEEGDGHEGGGGAAANNAAAALLAAEDASAPPPPCLKRRIVTNAHCTADHVSLTVRRHGSTRRWPARLVSVSHEADLAVITVDDDAFWWHQEEDDQEEESSSDDDETSGSEAEEDDEESGSDDDEDDGVDQDDDGAEAMSEGSGGGAGKKKKKKENKNATTAITNNKAKAAAAVPPVSTRSRRPAVGALRLMKGEPPIDVEVAVAGYPVGGDTVCVTRGVVSRLDRVFYAHGRTSHLAVQVSAAINSGNSGGPCLVFPPGGGGGGGGAGGGGGGHSGGGKRAVVMGVAFQALTSSQNCGHCIPAFLLRRLLAELKRVERGVGGGGAGNGGGAPLAADALSGPRAIFPALGASFQTLESADAHKAALGLPGAVAAVRRTKAERRAARAARTAAAAAAAASGRGDNGPGGGSLNTAATSGATTAPPPPTTTAATKAASGVLITFVEPTSPAAGVLRVGDVLARVDGHDVADDGTTLLAPGGQGLHLQPPGGAAGGGGGGLGGAGSRGASLGPSPARPLGAPRPPSAAARARQQQQDRAAAAALAAADARGGHDDDHNHGAVRVDFRYLISRRTVGDVLPVSVWRAGKLVDVSVPLAAPAPLVRPHSHDARPSYAVFGGLVLTPLTVWYLRQTWGTDWAHRAPLALSHPALAGVKRLPDEQVVVLSRVLAAGRGTEGGGGAGGSTAQHITAAYQDEGNVVVRRVDGVRVRSLRHCLALMLRGTTPEQRAAAGFGGWRPSAAEEEEAEGERNDELAYDPDDGFDDAAEEAQMREAMGAAAEVAAEAAAAAVWAEAAGVGGGGDASAAVEAAAKAAADAARAAHRYRYVRVSLSWGDQIVLDRAAALAATAGVLKSNSIASAASEDLLPPPALAAAAAAPAEAAAAGGGGASDAAPAGKAEAKKKNKGDKEAGKKKAKKDKKKSKSKAMQVDDLIIESEEEEEGLATAHAA